MLIIDTINNPKWFRAEEVTTQHVAIGRVGRFGYIPTTVQSKAPVELPFDLESNKTCFLFENAKRIAISHADVSVGSLGAFAIAIVDLLATPDNNDNLHSEYPAEGDIVH
mmetsp:Transcript_13745/g.22871  ORF Transcript_13745/g.22871 Transcript_13745/m.22871 type:complete len:110 (-) Transcript_13745:73-402(-)